MKSKRHITSTTDPDCGYINHGDKRGVGYLMDATVDCKHGILDDAEDIFMLKYDEIRCACTSDYPVKELVKTRWAEMEAAKKIHPQEVVWHCHRVAGLQRAL